MVLLKDRGNLLVHSMPHKCRTVRESHVILEVGQLCEALAAYFTGKGFLAGMNELVPLELGGCWKLFAAVLTFMAPVVHGGIGIAIGATAAGANLKVQWQGQCQRINATTSGDRRWLGPCFGT